MRRRPVAIALLLTVTLAGNGPRAQVTQPGNPPTGGTTVYPQPTPGWETAVSNPGNPLYYKPAYPIERCMTILEEGRSTQFDPAVLDALQRRSADIIQIALEQADQAAIGSAASAPAASGPCPLLW